MASKAISIGAAPVTLVETNQARTIIIIMNTHAAQTLTIDTDSSVQATVGIIIRAQGNLVMEKALGWETEKNWYVIGSGAATTGSVYEGFGVIPGTVTTPGTPPLPPVQYPEGPMGPNQVDP